MDPTGFIAGLTRETTIVRDRAGRWSQDGVLLEHPLLVQAFDRWVDVAEDGRFCLKNDINWAYVTIEGAPLFVRGAKVRNGVVELDLSNGQTEKLDPATLRQDRDGCLYCDARSGQMAAAFTSHAQNQLADLVGEDGGGIFLNIDGTRVRPPLDSEPLRVGRRSS